MLRQEHVFIAILLEQFAGINKENGGIGLGALFQYDDTSSDAYTKEKVGRQLDNGIYEVVLDEILANLLFITSTIQYARELYDSSSTTLREVPKHMHRKSKVGSTLWSQHACRGITLIINQNGVVLTFPL